MKRLISEAYNKFMSYSTSKDNPHQVTAEQAGVLTRPQVLALLQGFFKPDDIAITSFDFDESYCIIQNNGKAIDLTKPMNGYLFGRYFEFKKQRIYQHSGSSNGVEVSIYWDENLEIRIGYLPSSRLLPKVPLLKTSIKNSKIDKVILLKENYNLLGTIGTSKTKRTESIPVSDENGKVNWG